MNSEKLESLIQSGNDNALLRLTLGQIYLKNGTYQLAIAHLVRALELDPNYTAAWKIYAQALTEDQQFHAALDAYTHGITIAEQKGDLQAAKEMQVFKRRLIKTCNT